MDTTGPQDDARYATFPRRLNALTTDGIIVMAFSILTFLLAPSGESHPYLRLSLAFVWWGAILLYEPVGVAFFGGTVGHRLLNLRVVDERTLGNPTLAKAVLRLLVKVALGVLSFVSMSFTRKHQSLHDLLTGSTVRIRDASRAAPYHYVREQAPPPPPPPATP